MTAPTGPEHIQLRMTARNEARAAMAEVRGELQAIRREQTAGAQTFQTIRRDVAQAAVAVRAGRLDWEGYRVALAEARRQAAALSPALAQRLERDITRLGVVTRQTTVSTQGQVAAMAATARTAAPVRQGLGTIRSSMASLTAMMIGVRGTAGTLASGLLQFAAGNAIAVGVIGGLAAMAFGFRRLTRDAREARKELKELAEEGRKSFEQAILTPAQQAQGDVVQFTRAEADTRRALARERRGTVSPKSGLRTVDEDEVERLTFQLSDIVRGRFAAEQALAEAQTDAAAERRSQLAQEIRQLTRLVELEAARPQHLARLQQLLGETEGRIAGGLPRDQEITAREQLRAIQQALVQEGLLSPEVLPEFRAQVAEAAQKAMTDAAKMLRDDFRGDTAAGLGETFLSRARRGGRGGVATDRELEGFQDALGGGTGALRDFARAVRADVITPQQQYAITLFQLDQALTAGLLTEAEHQRAKDAATATLERASAASDRAAAADERRAAAAITLASHFAAQMIRGGASASGFLGFAGGLASFVNPLAGAALGGLGTIVGALESRDRDRTQRVHVESVSDRAARDLRPRTGPDNVTVNIVDPFGNRLSTTEHELWRRSRRDARERLPAGVSLG